MIHRIGRSSSNGLQYFFLYQTWDERHSLNLCYVTRCSMEPSLILLLWSILDGVHYHIRLIIGHLHNTHYNSWLCHPLIKTALASICCKLDFSPFLCCFIIKLTPHNGTLYFSTISSLLIIAV